MRAALGFDRADARIDAVSPMLLAKTVPVTVAAR
jgi:hypothetical protein